jgi:hypothetical protein
MLPSATFRPWLDRRCLEMQAEACKIMAECMNNLKDKDQEAKTK